MTRPIRIGIAVALSGEYALLGRQVRAGVECYRDDINGAGGLRVCASAPRRPLELVVHDDRSDPRLCGEQVRALAEDPSIDLLLGPYGSGPTRAAARAAAAAGCVLWNHSGSAEGGGRAGARSVVNILSPAADYFGGVLELLRQSVPTRPRLALFSARTGFAEEVAAGVIERTGVGDFAPIVHHRYASGEDCFAELLAGLAADPPDCILGAGRIADDLNLARALARSRVAPRALALVVAGIDAFGQQSGIDAEGVIGPSQWEPDARYRPDCGPSATEFVRRMRRYQHAPVDYPGAQGYVAGLIAGTCVETAGSLDPVELRATAERLDLLTFYGAFRLDPASGQQTGHEVLATQWQGGTRRIVWPPRAANGELIWPLRTAS
jgi:branched-chain amino acid transport system substrate-binding protein